MRDLDYQARALARFDAYLTELAAQKARAEETYKLACQNATLHLPRLDFPAETWLPLREAGKPPVSRANIPYSGPARVRGFD